LHRIGIVVLLAAALLASGTHAGAQVTASGNRSNAAFATVADGLLGPMVVDVPTGASRATIDSAVALAWQRGKPTARAASEVHRFLVRHRLLSPNSRLSFSRPVVLRESGRLRLPELEQLGQTRGRLGGGEITFTYQGWTAQDLAAVRGFVDLMYPVAKQIYGAPSAKITVRIVRDDLLRDSAMHLRSGIYNASTNEIRINPTGDFRDDMYFLTHLVLYAFHDDALFAYDSWEEGFTWAATYAIYKYIQGNYDLGESHKTFYFLPLYELMNLPGIGNPRFWPANFDQMVAADNAAVFPFWSFVLRSGMAGAAWAKAYVENPNFFSSFNAAYYQRFAPGLAGNVPALKAIAASVVPTVEGLAFDDWYRRQHILDTSVRDGRHFWVYAVPTWDPGDHENRSLALLFFNFQRAASGNETPLGGTAKLTYYSWDFIQDYFAEEGNEAIIPSAGTDAGVGVISPAIYNVGGPQKVNVQVTLDGITRMVLWPYLVRGPESSPNDLYGVALDSEAGKVGVIVGSGQEKVVDLTQAAFGMKAGLNGWHKLSVRVTDAEGRFVTRQINTGYDSYAAIVQGPRPPAATYTKKLPAGTHMISVPAYPAVADAEALGVPANRLRLAHWDPTYVSGTDGYRYRIYPGTPPLAPGIGYWLMLSQETTISFQGNPLPQDQSFFIPLRPGWNQIGHPFLQAVPVNTLSVSTDPTDPEKAIPLATAVSRGLVSGTFWAYTQQAGYTPAQSLEPWLGYWVKAETNLLLKVPAVASPGQNPPAALLPGDPVVGDVRSAALASDATADGWRLQLQARVGNTAGSVLVGTSRAATDGFDALHDAQRPPDLEQYVRLAVQHPEWGRAAGDYAIDIRSEGPLVQAWEILLDTSERNRDVHLSWQGLSSLPRDVRLFLADLDGGQRCYLRTSSGLVINSGETGRRRLRLEARRGPAGALMISNIVVTPTRGPGSLEVQFTISADAVVNASVMSPSGRPVRELARSRAVSAGTNRLLWDGRSEPGVKLASGVYLLQLTATTEEGQSVRAVRPVVLTR
jgi:hypothetical protein